MRTPFNAVRGHLGASQQTRALGKFSEHPLRVRSASGCLNLRRVRWVISHDLPLSMLANEIARDQGVRAPAPPRRAGVMTS